MGTLHEMSEERITKGYPERVLILGDSLSFARAQHGQRFEDSWPSQIKARFPGVDVWQRCEPAAGILEVKRELELFAPFSKSFSHVLIHAGITDLCPRPFPRVFRGILLVHSGTYVRRTINQHYRTLLKFYSAPWVSSQVFAQTLKFIFALLKERSPETQIGMIKIPDAGPRFARRVPDIQRHIALYNSIILEHVRIAAITQPVEMLDPYQGDTGADLLLPDGHHFSLRGHTLVAQSVAEFLLK